MKFDPEIQHSNYTAYKNCIQITTSNAN